MLNGETIATGGSPCCPDCKKTLVLSVCRSAAGHYVGTWCDCGPYSRESGYYNSQEEAQAALDSGAFSR